MNTVKRNLDTENREKALLFDRNFRFFGKHLVLMLSIILLGILNCKSSTEPNSKITKNAATDYEPVPGCDGQTYPDPSTTPYVLPYAVGKSFVTGLTNCSSSFHGPGQPDQYAFDFNMPLGTPFVAARGGRVYEIVQNATGGNTQSDANIVGNYVIIDHGDGSFGIYLHAPDDGIFVSVNDVIKKGDLLGVAGSSGLAGYPHLHFIVVDSEPVFPYMALQFHSATHHPRTSFCKATSNIRPRSIKDDRQVKI